MGFFSFLSTKKKLTESLDEQLKDEKNKKKKPTDAERLAFLISGDTKAAVTADPFSHMTYKGQVGMIAQSTGMGVSAGAKVDLAQIFLPGSPLKAAVGASVSIKGGKHRLVIVERQAEDVGTNAKPFALINMKGYHGALKIALEASVGAGYDDFKQDVGGAEARSFQVELSASVSAGASYEGTYLRASDPTPLYFGSGESTLMRTALNNALTLNRGTQVPVWDRQTYLSLWTHTGTLGASYKIGAGAKLVSREEAKEHGMQLGASIEMSGNIEGTLKAALYRLQTLASHGLVSTQDTTVTFKRVGGKLFQFDGGMKAGWGTWDEKGDKEEEDKLKKQSRSERAHEDYKVKEGEGEASVINVDKDGITVKFEDIGGVGEDSKFTVVDSFSYSTAIWVWDRADMLRPRDGSGYLRGHSVIVETLHAYYRMYPPKPKPVPGPAPASGRQRRGAISRLASSGTKKDSAMFEVDKHIRALAKSLHVPLGYLIAFFDGHGEKLAPFVAACVEAKQESEEAKVDDAVILEVAFGIDLRALNREMSSTRVARFKKKNPDEVMPDFRATFEKILAQDDETFGNIQAIRLRVQRHKEKNNDKAAFSLGLKLKVTSLNFSIDIVNRFASGATETLAETWLGEHVDHVGPALPRGAVPPAILFF